MRYAPKIYARLGPHRRLIVVVIAGLAILAGLGAFAAQPRRGQFEGPVRAILLDVIDGDTLAVRARIWIDQDIETRVRIAGIDAPELKGKCAAEIALAQKAREFLRLRLGRADGQPAEIILREIRNDKYGGRVIARVLGASGEDIAAALLSAGLAHAYDGGKRESWC